ncbi:MAG TPA: nucleoside-diphosphate sugar epimerase/dehydratase [Lacibacter sp.]|nr:nucleoside-diphosphate sugar epimerase/dehydratase [Lacibacter sp.]HMO90534.1 nucleoside-diphosphate sugar epimerase/dehydratase [Lacibacter sp.]
MKQPPKPLKLTPARIVLLGDIVLIGAGLLSGILLNYRILSITEIPLTTTGIRLGLHLGLAITAWYSFRIHRRVIRHFHVRDYVQLILILGLVHVVSASFDLLLEEKHHYSLMVWIMSYFITAFYVLTSRILVSYLFEYYKRTQRQGQDKRLLIFGAGALGLTLKKSINNHPESEYRIMGFIDDDPNKIGKIIEGYEVYSAEADIRRTIVRLGITDIIIATKTLHPVRKSKFLNDTIIFNLRIRELPSLQRWFESHFNLGTIQQIDIHDLLNREAIQLQNPVVEQEFRSKTILVTGAAGSIGSELVRRLSDQHAGTIVCLDSAETPLYDLQQGLRRSHPEGNYHFVLADVRNEERMAAVLEQHRPNYVFHAAAYKHVPIIEQYPLEGLHTNVVGTWHMAQLAGRYGAEKFVLVSTDKAINPTSVMGASKRIAEMATQSVHEIFPQTEFIITRFGNVLGSNGSVVPLFKNQIANGGPVTVTHPEMQRYFMTIPEAAQLVLEAAVMGKKSEVFIFDMGQPVKIYDLAMNMIRLAGMVPGVDITIEFSGMRAGEKLYEDLFADQEQVEKTHHKKIMIGRVRQYRYAEMQQFLLRLSQLPLQAPPVLVRDMIQSIVPEYQPFVQATEISSLKS